MNATNSSYSAPKVSHTFCLSAGFRCAAVLLLSLVLSGCGRAINRSAERRIRDILPDIIGSAREYRVHVSGPDTDTARGRIQAVSVDGRDINLANGLMIDNLHLEMTNISADFGHKQIRSVESAHFTATIGEAALDEYMAGESPDGETLRNVRFSIREGAVTITGERVVLGLGVPFRAYGPLRLTGPEKIELDPNKLVVVGIPITGAPLRFIKKKFESAMDLSSLPVPMRLDGIAMHSHRLVLSGTPDIGAILRLRQAEGAIK